MRWIGLVIFGLAGQAFAEPNPAEANVKCTLGGQNILQITNTLPERDTTLKKVRALAQRPDFVANCIKQTNPKQRDCLVHAKTPKGWIDCFKPEPKPEVDPPRDGVCSRPAGPNGPVIVSAGEYARRHTLTHFAKATETPLQVCGIPATQSALMAMQCADGSRPFAAPLQVAKARVGNRGRGGLCKTMIDHYEVKCPEKTYSVYVDMYWCRPGMWPHY